MKKFLLSLVFALALSSFAFPQSKFPELDKIKQLRLLASTREDVKKILADYKLNFSSATNHVELFSSTNADIEVRYASGKCSDEWGEDWNVPEWKVRLIHIAISNPIRVEDFGIDLSKYKKERIFGNIKETYKYHKKASGIGYSVNENGVYGITLIPSKENYPLLCNTRQVKKYYAGKSWFNSKLKHRIKEPERSANVLELNLSKEAIMVSCETNVVAEIGSKSDEARIHISTQAETLDPSDVLIYNYSVSGGKIIGNGARVVWDLSGVKPGKYTITAAVDNGCGICGKTMTKEIVVKDCPDCSPK